MQPPDGPLLSSTLISSFGFGPEGLGDDSFSGDLELGYKGSLADLEQGEKGVARKKTVLHVVVRPSLSDTLSHVLAKKVLT